MPHLPDSGANRPGLTRRQIGGLCLGLPALTARPAQAARGITIAGIDGWFQTAFDSIVLAAFRKAHPEIPVFYYPVGNPFQTLALLRSQRQYPTADVVLLEAGVATAATAENLLEPLQPATMPVIDDLSDRAKLPNVAGPAVFFDSLAMCYNTADIKQPPKFWRNLWDPTYGRRIALPTPPDAIALAMTAVAGKLFGGGEPLRSLELGLVALAQLAPQVVLWDPVPDVYTAVALGDASIGPGWNARAQNQMSLTPGRFAATIPEGGSPVMVMTVNLVKNAQQATPARTLISWLLGPEAQRLLAEGMFYAPVNPKADLSAATLVRVGATPGMVAKRMDMDWVVVDAIRDQITREWRRRNLKGH